MAEPKKKSVPPSAASKSPADGPEVSSTLGGLLPREELDRLSTLQLIDLIVSKLPPRHPAILDMVYLRERISSVEEMNDEARQAIEKMDAIIEKLRSPAFRVGTLLMPIQPDQAHVCAGGTDYVCRIDPQIPLASLQVGQRVLLNEAFAVVQGLGFDRNGPIVRIDELLSDGRLRIGQESGLMPLVLQRSALLSKEKLKPGMDIRLDVNQRVALEVIGVGKRVERSLETVAELPWSSIGGQEEAVTRSSFPFCIAICSNVSSTRCRKVFCFTARLAAAKRCSAKRPLTICASRSKPKAVWTVRNSSCTSKDLRF